MITPLMETVIAKVEQVPAAKEDVMAQRILEELADEQKWDKAFAESQEALGRLASEARDDVKKRKRQFGSAKGLITMAPDFDEPLEDFREYTQ